MAVTVVVAVAMAVVVAVTMVMPVAMIMRVAMVVRVRVTVVVAVAMFVRVRLAAGMTVLPYPDVRGRDSRAHHSVDYQLVIHAQAAERLLQGLQRQPRIEQCRQNHVAGSAGETVEVQHARHQTSSAFLIETKSVSARIR